MFENLTSREKKLLYAVLALAPITVIFVGVFWFISSMNQNFDQFKSLDKAIQAEKAKELQGFQANRRMNYYNSVALPANFEVANNEYGSWLKLLIEKEGMSISSFQPRDAGSLRASLADKEIGRKKRFIVQARSNLKQLNEFLKKFYAVDVLHRIDTLKVVPITEGTGKKKVRSGELSLSMTFETLSLNDAGERDDFLEQTTNLARDDAEYDKILQRNIFGPANNPPTLTARKRIEVYTDSTASVTFTGKDADNADKLTFELLESDIEGLELKTSRTTARLNFKSQEERECRIKVRVSDSGYPAKFDEAETLVVFKKRPPPKPRAKTTPPPPFKHLPHTRVTGITSEVDGSWVAFIEIRTSGKNYMLKVGETFQLDDAKWEITSIDAAEVMFRSGDKTYVARPNPRDEGKLVEVSTRKTSSKKDDTQKTANF